MPQRYYFTTRELVTMAILSALGGVLSTYIGYLGNLINRTLGIPFGAGQFMAGLHVFWMILAYAIIGKPGTGTSTGILKGMVEFFAGSTHGIPIVLVSLIEGIFVDLTLTAFKKPSATSYCLAGALASMSNVLIFQILYFSGVPMLYLLLIASIAALSGVIFAGYFGRGTLQVLTLSHVVKIKHDNPTMSKFNLQSIFAVSCIAILAGGAAVYYTQIYKPFINPLSCQITGDVEQPFLYHPSDFADTQVTVIAELKGSYTYVPPKNYTGVPLPIILTKTEPETNSHTVSVIASDGYEATFNLTKVMHDDKLILIQEDGSLRLVAANYDGSYWVKQVCEIRVEP